MGDAVKKVNDGVYLVEKAIVVASMLVMSVIVFLDVVHRQYTATESKIVGILAFFLRLDKESSGYASLDSVSLYLAFALAFFLIFMGVRTASRRPLLPPREPTADQKKAWDAKEKLGIPVALGAATVGTALGYGLLWLLFGDGQLHGDECQTGGFQLRCGYFPNGLIWSQKVALMFTIWVGFLGASMATRDNRHLKVEAAQRLLPEAIVPTVRLLAGLATAGFCLLLTLLAFDFAHEEYSVYVQTDGLGGTFEGTEVPTWYGFGMLPVAYGLMTVRFVINGILAFRGELAEGLGELGDLDLSGIDEEDEGGVGDASQPGPGARNGEEEA